MKLKRSKVEVKLLKILNELINDIKIVKQKSDPKSHKNKMSLKSKIKILQNELNKYRMEKEFIKTYLKHSYPQTTENIKYQRKIENLIKKIEMKLKKEDKIKKVFIKMTKKDIKKNRLTVEILEKIIDYTGDKTWDREDMEDTINKIKKLGYVGIGYTHYKDIENNLNNKSIYIDGSNKKGEYLDVPKENLSFYLSNKKIKTYSLKKFLKKIDMV
jgi:hypothetical protein